MYLNVTIRTPVGVVTGWLNKSSCDHSVLVQTRDGVQQNSDKMSYLVVYGPDPAMETTLPGTLVKNSAITFTIDERPLTRPMKL